MMKTKSPIYAAAFALLLGLSVVAFFSNPSELLADDHGESSKSGGIAKEDWETNFSEAQAKAREHGKMLLLEFHGSDWCPPCIQLNKQILSTAEFKKIADEHFVLVNLDFPRKSEQPADQAKHNRALAEKFGIQGFPTVVLLDAEGNEVAREVGFPRGGKDGFLEFLKKNS